MPQAATPPKSVTDVVRVCKINQKKLLTSIFDTNLCIFTLINGECDAIQPFDPTLRSKVISAIKAEK